jgi:hypothetical protein
MYFRDGFALESPAIVVPWLISETDLAALLSDERLKRVTGGYHTFETTVWDGLGLTIGFHFTPRVGGELREFEVFRTDPYVLSDQASFAELQSRLEARLGNPSESSGVDSRYPSAMWFEDSYAVTHLLQNRFGDEEILRVKTSRAV